MPKIGFIGVGNMGESILRAIFKDAMVPVEDVYIFDMNTQKVRALQEEFGVLTAQSASAMVAACDIVLLAVKPHVCASVLKECADAIDGKAIISIVAGWSRKQLSAIVPAARVLRVMPNTPCMIGEGMSALEMDHTLRVDELEFAKTLFESIGKAVMVPTSLMAAVTGVSGSGPAYVYLFIESLADAGVRAGLPRDMAYTLAAQTVVGAGKMVLETGRHPGALKDAVCSPAGTTIEAVTALERAGFRAAVMDGVEACVEKALDLEDN